MASYGEQAGIATEPKQFIVELRKQLTERAQATDKSFPDNHYLRFEDGEPILTPAEAAPDPEGLDHAVALIKERMEPIEILLQRLWGTGQSASADGMQWDLYPQNLMSQYHIRYGGYGGIGYYLVADNYIALMSRWTPFPAVPEGH